MGKKSPYVHLFGSAILNLKRKKILQIIVPRMSAVKWNVPGTCFRLLRETFHKVWHYRTVLHPVN
jgi:hypothetical protein